MYSEAILDISVTVNNTGGVDMLSFSLSLFQAVVQSGCIQNLINITTGTSSDHQCHLQ